MAHNDLHTGPGPGNYEQKCPVVLILDVSGSMSGKPIDELNKGLQVFQQELQKDAIASARLDLAIVSFGSDVNVEHEFTLLSGYQMPTLTIRGTTKLVDGMREGIAILEARKQWYKQSNQTYYRPYVILITDGYPDSDQDITGLESEIKAGVNGKAFNFWPIGVEGASMDMLNKLAVPGVGASLSALKLNGLKFVEMFKWLSSSMAKISKSKEGEAVDIQPREDKNLFMITT